MHDTLVVQMTCCTGIQKKSSLYGKGWRRSIRIHKLYWSVCLFQV